MAAFRKETLLDIPPYPASGYARLADRIGAILGTANDVLLVQGEAIVALEAVAASLAGPGVQALNVVTSPYGRLFGTWLRRGGAEVLNITASPGRPIAIETVAEAFAARPGANLVSLVHAESASGILNPLPAIAELARARGALLVVDAVASVGGHPLDVGALGIDVAVIGAQKSLGGSAGLSALSVSERAWRRIDRPDAPDASTLSLLDLRRNWLDAGRRALPGMPSALEFHALEAALDRVEAEGMDALLRRHALAAQATRTGIRALGLSPWVDDGEASNLVTTLLPPDGVDLAALLAHPAAVETELSAGVGEVADGLVRLNHTGQRARCDIVLATLLALGEALRAQGYDAPLDGAAEAVAVTHGD